MDNTIFELFHKRYSDYLRQQETLLAIIESGSAISFRKRLASKKYDELKQEIHAFVETEYAPAVFVHFSQTKPQLIRIRTGEVYTWNEAFGETFDAVPKSLRHALVGLVEGGGRYRLKQ